MLDRLRHEYAQQSIGHRANGLVANPHLSEQATDGLVEIAPLVRFLSSRTDGLSIVADAIWKALGLTDVFDDIAGSTRCMFPVERSVFAMVINRLVDPLRSDRSAKHGGRPRQRQDTSPHAASAAASVSDPGHPAALHAAGVSSLADMPNCARCVPRRSNSHVR